MAVVHDLHLLRIESYGELLCLGEGALVDHREGGVVDGVAGGVFLPRVDDIDGAAHDAEPFRLCAAELAGGVDMQRRGVDAHHARGGVAGHIHLPAVTGDITRAAVAHIDAGGLACGAVDGFDRVGTPDGDIYLVAIDHHILRHVAQASSVEFGEETVGRGHVAVVDDAEFGFVVAPSAFVEDYGSVFGQGGDIVVGFGFLASGQQQSQA